MPMFSGNSRSRREHENASALLANIKTKPSLRRLNPKWKCATGYVHEGTEALGAPAVTIPKAITKCSAKTIRINKAASIKQGGFFHY